MTATEKTHNERISVEPAEARPSLDGDASSSRFIVVMGVSGTGKSTLGAALSEAFHLPFIDGDDLHPAANVAKMSRGEPLDDVDRQPWLDAIREIAIARVLEQATRGELTPGVGVGRSSMRDGDGDGERRRRPGVIVACSSLKKAYRAVLRGEPPPKTWRTERIGLNPCPLPTYFVYLKGDRDVLMARMQNREGHFMKADMLDSQLNTLESPEDEPGVVTVSVEMSTAEQVQRVVEMVTLTERRSSSPSTTATIARV